MYTLEQFKNLPFIQKYVAVESLANKAGYACNSQFNVILFQLEDFFVAVYYVFRREEWSIVKFVADRSRDKLFT